MDFLSLRAKHPKFFYKGFEVLEDGSDLKVRFNFFIFPELEFKPEITFHNIPKDRLEELGKESLNNLIFNLGMIEMFSYWKATCSPEIIIEAGFLGEGQVKWWHNLLIEGMGEFYFVNQVNFLDENLVKLTTASDRKYPFFEKSLPDRDLVLVGGGKDSAVTLDIMGNSGRDFNVMLLAPTQAAKEMADIGGSKNPIVVSRTIDPNLLELNKRGYLNGHTPFSTYLAFLSTVVSVVYGYKNALVSNEASSNEGNVEYLGKSINHQISKSYQFEKMFDTYSKKYLTGEFNYFSFLRPLSELQIARLFFKMGKFHQVFRSCNKGSKAGIWCLDCPKCLFATLILYPFLGSQIMKVFGKNMLEDEQFLEMGKSLIGVGGNLKPFDCVGTHLESQIAVYLGIKKAQDTNQHQPIILSALKSLILMNDGQLAREAEVLLESWNQENNLSAFYQSLLRKAINEN